MLNVWSLRVFLLLIVQKKKPSLLIVPMSWPSLHSKERV